MRGPELIGHAPREVRWSLDSKTVYFRWKTPGRPVAEPLAWYAAARNEETPPRKLDETAAREMVPPAGGDYCRDRKRVVYAEAGELWVMEAGVPGRQRLTDTTVLESDPRWTRDEQHVAFTREGNLFVMPAHGSPAGPLVQLTDIFLPASALAQPPSPPSAAEKIARDNEKKLFDVLRERAGEVSASRPRKRKPFVLGVGQVPVELALSPDERVVLVTIRERPARAPRTSLVPRYLTESGFVEASPGRPFAGEEPETTSLVLLDVATGAARPVTPPAALAGRALSFGSARWSPRGDSLITRARSLDNHDTWLLAVDPATGKTTLVHWARDNAWIGGPGWSWWEWLPGGNVAVLSEKTGWAHLASVAAPNGVEAPLTTGRFEVFDPQLSRNGTTWFFTSSEAHRGERHFYQMPASGGPRTRLTRAAGSNETTLSPDETTLAVIHSYTNRPPELFLQPCAPSAPRRQITHSSPPAFGAYPWRDVPVVTFAARDGAIVHARLFSPSKKGSRPGPAVLFVHGAGYLQNAHRAWSRYEREYLFHHLLAESGYTVLDIDYRGSAGYGRDWRTGIFKHMGGKDLNDLVDGARWLVKTQNVDSKRIGLYGGSYGGFLTLMALFTTPNVWACGAALRPVSDWSKYNNGYTAPILGLPQSDPAAFQRSSPIFWAQGLQKPLLICHGMQDNNVFFQDTVRLTQRLLELGKTDWEVAFYPVEDHAFVHASSWADQYRRIFQLFERTLMAR